MTSSEGSRAPLTAPGMAAPRFAGRTGLTQAWAAVGKIVAATTMTKLAQRRSRVSTTRVWRRWVRKRGCPRPEAHVCRDRGWDVSPRTMLGTGFCGGLTTWSAAAWEMVALAEEGAWLAAAGNIVCGLATSVSAAAIGLAIAA